MVFAAKLYSSRNGGFRVKLEGPIPPKLIRQINMFSPYRTKDGVTLPAEPTLLDIIKQDPEAELNPACERLLESYQEWYTERLDLATKDDVDLSEEYSTLFPHQRVGAQFLCTARRALLADSPGLGKTATAISAVKLSNEMSAVLVLCPSAVKSWWTQEIARWHPDVPVTVGNAATKKVDFENFRDRGGYYVTNWEHLRIAPWLSGVTWDWIIGDEAHRARNRKTKIFRALKMLRYKRLALLTATPMSNDPSDLWGLLNLIDPKRFTSFWTFYNLFVDYVELPNGGRIVLGERNPKLLQKIIAPYILKRSYDDANIKMPEMTTRRIYLNLSKQQQKLYNAIVREAVVVFESGEQITAMNAVAKLTRLRQVTSTTATVYHEDYSSKLDAAVDLIRDSGDEAWVVFSEFRATVQALCRRLEEAGISYTYVLGGMPSAQVGKAVDDFQSGKVQVFVATSGAGGVGITLSRARFLLLLEKWFSPDRQQQSTHRVYRIGQDRNVVITELICENTVDELVEDILQRKISIRDSVFIEMLHEHLRNAIKRGAARGDG